MRYMVVSDTHGNIGPVLDVYKRRAAEKPIDAIIHLGDYACDASEIKEALDCDVISVNGNMDSAADGAEDQRILETEFGPVLLVHGHRQNVKLTLQNLIYRTEELNCKAVLFGHTHKPCFENDYGIFLLNPGSIALPVGRLGSYAMLETSKEQFSATILFYDPNPAPIRAGKLYDMLNNADRA